jgi:hypothetical protein
MTSQDSLASGITTDDLAKVSRTKAFFGHQSVGMNMLDGVPPDFPMVTFVHVTAPLMTEQG